MEKAYRAFEERKSQRWKAFVAFVALLTIETLGVVCVAYTVKWFWSYGPMIVLLSFLFGAIYIMTRPWAGEWYETKIFVRTYEAFKLLELCSNEDGSSMFYSRKATKKVRGAIRTLNKWAEHVELSSSKLINREYTEPLRNLVENIETRILPRIAQNKDIIEMISVLRGMAKLFGEIQKSVNLEEINSKNKDLERYEPIELERTPSRLRFLLSMNPFRLLCSFLLSFFIITTALFIRSMFVPTDLMDLFGLPTFVEIIGIGFAIALGIYAIWKRKT